MPVKISSTVEGFRRCGVSHGRQPVIHEDGTFTNAQLAALQNEPMLKVEIIKEEKKKKGEE